MICPGVGPEQGLNSRAHGVILKVCEALTYAHSKSVIHRDLKPGNIMVGTFGGTHVMDWGDAKPVLSKESGVALVLIPAGKSLMGAQRGEPAGKNFNPDAETDEGPVHQAELPPTSCPSSR